MAENCWFLFVVLKGSVALNNNMYVLCIVVVHKYVCKKCPPSLQILDIQFFIGNHICDDVASTCPSCRVNATVKWITKGWIWNEIYFQDSSTVTCTVYHLSTNCSSWTFITLCYEAVPQWQIFLSIHQNYIIHQKIFTYIRK